VIFNLFSGRISNTDLLLFGGLLLSLSAAMFEAGTTIPIQVDGAKYTLISTMHDLHPFELHSEH